MRNANANRARQYWSIGPTSRGLKPIYRSARRPTAIKSHHAVCQAESSDGSLRLIDHAVLVKITFISTARSLARDNPGRSLHVIRNRSLCG
jgi:hypothetical protein